jgi:hypothetical protein
MIERAARTASWSLFDESMFPSDDDVEVPEQRTWRRWAAWRR